MKRIAILAIAIVMLARLGYSQDLSIESIDILLPENTCTYQWKATIENNGAVAASGIIAVQGRQGHEGNWHPAAGSSISDLGPGQTKTATAKWIRKPGVTEFKIEVYHNGTIVTEEIMPLSIEPPTDLQIISANFNDNGYSFSIRNNAPHPASDVIAQSSMATAQTPNTWVPIGGDTIPCIASGAIEQKSYMRQSGWKDGYTRFKITLYRGGVSVGERIFIAAASPPTRGTELTPLRTLPKSTRRRSLYPGRH